MTTQLLIVPGWGNSGPLHWQSLWQAELPTAQRVMQNDWDRPTLTDWVDTLTRQLSRVGDAPVVLLAHSLGCITIAHLPEAAQRHVAAALLVAPADVERPQVDPALANFAPIPLRRLPYPSIVVASDDDPHCSRERAETFANAWGSEWVLLHGAGHINSGAGFGAWPDGRRLLTHLIDRITISQ